MGQSFDAGPKPTDYTPLAQQDAAAGAAAVEAQTQANPPDINTPLTTIKWERGPNGEWILNQGL